MKKLVLAIAALYCMQGMNAQDLENDVSIFDGQEVAAEGSSQDKVSEFGIFDHVAAGITLGTTGIGFEVAAPVTNYLQVRAGYSFLPEISYKADVEYKASKVKHETEIEAKMKWGNAHLLADLYPIKNSSFRVTLGAYIGSDEIVTAQNNDPLVGVLPGEGLEIGDYIIGPDNKGIARAKIKVNSFKPYAGIGFGRAVPKGRFGFSGDLGVQFWGSPTVYGQSTDGKSWEKATSEDTGNNDKNAIKTISKVSVWPVLNLRFSVRLF